MSAPLTWSSRSAHPTAARLSFRPSKLHLVVESTALLLGGLVTNAIRLVPELVKPEAAGHEAPFGEGVLAPVFTPSVAHWSQDIVTWAEDWALDPNLVATVMQIESCGYSEAVSNAGAQGLFQVMPFHFNSGEAMREPHTNARRGLAYLAKGLALSNGDIRLALAGYNGGHSQISRHPEQWPAETQRYVYWGTGIYTDLSSGLESSPTLTAWLAAGGESLCAQARVHLGF